MTDAFLESQAWLELRYRVLKKHNGCCHLCGSRGSDSNPIQVDHIKPRSKFPHLSLVEANLQVLCRACNVGKSNKDATDWRWSPSRELTIIHTAKPADRAKLQQLGWLRLNGDKQMRASAEAEYKSLWKRVEADWFARGRPE